MTCIVGIEHDGVVTIGADSCGSNDEMKAARADTKLFQVGPYLFGFTTSFRMGQLLHYSLKPSRPDIRDLDRHMSTTFIDEVRECFSDGGFAERSNAVERGGTFLVGVHGRLYCIEGDYQVGRYNDGYIAVGSGEPYALGSLATTAQYDYAPKVRVRLALEAAAKHNPYVGGPFTIKTMK